MSHVASAHGRWSRRVAPHAGKLGQARDWIFLAGDAVGFGTLLAGYGMMRATSGTGRPVRGPRINLTPPMTFLLICSSVTMVKGLSGWGRATRDARKRTSSTPRSAADLRPPCKPTSGRT